MHTVLNVVKDADQALVACRTPTWECLVVDLPSCNLLRSIRIDVSSLDEECQQIRSSKFLYLPMNDLKSLSHLNI